MISNVHALEINESNNPNNNNKIEGKVRENLLEKKRKLEGGGQISIPNLEGEKKYKTRYDRKTGRMVIDFSESES